MDARLDYRHRLFSYFVRYKGYAIPGLVAMIVISLGRIVQPLILREIIDKAVPAADTYLLLRYAISYLVVVAIVGALAYVGNMLIAKLGLSIVTLIKEDIFTRLLTLPVSYFDAHPVGEMMSRTENDTEKVRDLFSTLGVSFVVSVLMMAGMFIVAFALAPVLALIMVGAVAGFLAILLLFFNKVMGLYDLSRSLYAKIFAKVTEFMQGIEILHVFDRTGWAQARLDETGVRRRRNDVKASFLEYSAMAALDSLAGPLFIVLLIYIYSPRVLAGSMTLGTFILLVEYGASLLRPVVEIAESIRRMQQARVSLDRIMTIMSLSEEPGRQAVKEARFEKEIRFEHVFFAYKGEDWVLKDVSFGIPKGSVIAAVGASGSGKSTMVNLLCGFYQAGKGMITIDGVPLDHINLLEWRRKTGLVLQDAYLFPGSIVENVRVYNDAIPETRVRQALADVHASAMVDSLPQGADTSLWERGGNISSGEKQLLAFARALAVDPELVILDEATSNIDVGTEEKIRRSMDVVLAGRTALIVAQRLSSILHADRILYFGEGRIIAQGTHDELFESLPEYRKLVERQFIHGEAR